MDQQTKDAIVASLGIIPADRLRVVARALGVAPHFMGPKGRFIYLRAETLRQRIREAADKLDHQGFGKGWETLQAVMANGQAVPPPPQQHEIPEADEPTMERADHGDEPTMETTSDRRTLLDALDRIIDGKTPKAADLDEARVQTMIDAAVTVAMAKVTTAREVVVTVPDREPVNVGKAHKTFPELLDMINAGVWPWMTGPAGSGKTYAAEQAAKALGLDFYFDGRTDTDYKLLGYLHPTLGAIETPFKAAWTNGGLYLADEIDAWENQAALALQAALSNGACPFPGHAEPLPRHPDFRMAAAANTWGYGADSQYVGRTKLDAAFLDRFTFLPWGYDEALESSFGTAEVVGKVRELRARAQAKGLKIVISPRAVLDVTKLMAVGWSLDRAIRSKVTDRLPAADRAALGITA